MGNDNLIYVINGDKYILVELMIIQNNRKEIEKVVKECGLVFQGIKEVSNGSLWGKSFAILKYLLPEKNFEKYSQFNLL